ncbi:MAG: hypothetical protein INR71_12515 [Terriglobus roseus]|nr:hypothetical protein [Terriglobus roseus]
MLTVTRLTPNRSTTILAPSSPSTLRGSSKYLPTLPNPNLPAPPALPVFRALPLAAPPAPPRTSTPYLHAAQRYQAYTAVSNALTSPCAPVHPLFCSMAGRPYM